VSPIVNPSPLPCNISSSNETVDNVQVDLNITNRNMSDESQQLESTVKVLEYNATLSIIDSPKDIDSKSSIEPLFEEIIESANDKILKDDIIANTSTSFVNTMDLIPILSETITESVDFKAVATIQSNQLVCEGNIQPSNETCPTNINVHAVIESNITITDQPTTSDSDIKKLELMFSVDSILIHDSSNETSINITLDFTNDIDMLHNHSLENLSVIIDSGGLTIIPETLLDSKFVEDIEVLESKLNQSNQSSYMEPEITSDASEDIVSYLLNGIESEPDNQNDNQTESITEIVIIVEDGNSNANSSEVIGDIVLDSEVEGHVDTLLNPISVIDQEYVYNNLTSDIKINEVQNISVAGNFTTEKIDAISTDPNLNTTNITIGQNNLTTSSTPIMNSNQQTTSTTSVKVPSCLETLKFLEFKAKMEAKFSMTSYRDGSSGAGSETSSQENVFSQLMQKIKHLEMSHAIYELYAIQVHDTCNCTLLNQFLSSLNNKHSITDERMPPLRFN
jgi:hypothetical protein